MAGCGGGGRRCGLLLRKRVVQAAAAPAAKRLTSRPPPSGHALLAAKRRSTSAAHRTRLARALASKKTRLRARGRCDGSEAGGGQASIPGRAGSGRGGGGGGGGHCGRADLLVRPPPARCARTRTSAHARNPVTESGTREREEVRRVEAREQASKGVREQGRGRGSVGGSKGARERVGGRREGGREGEDKRRRGR